ncbi:hypothetical protein Taro_020077 [Colocasia esculenta]|uniref:Uncharacterized protein n=1 Tax=Colocasia esculenta TaxID=4460 RepID=A0A843UVC6_COLES|nr:hypothetical protein [Colocasia esculenta]
MVRGGRSGRGSTSSGAPSTSVGRGVRLPADYAGCPGDRVCLPDNAGCPGDRVHLSPSSITCPIPFNIRGREPSSSGGGVGSASWTPAMLDFWVNLITSNLPYLLFMLYSSCRKLMCNCRGKIDPGPASRYITSLLQEHIPGPVDSWKEFPLSVWDLLFDMFMWRYMFTRPKNLPRARVVWKSTAQTNFRKSMWEAQKKAVKTTGSQDSTAWMDYSPVWMRKDYWESLCHRWATGPWQESVGVVFHSHFQRARRTTAHKEGVVKK